MLWYKAIQKSQGKFKQAIHSQSFLSAPKAPQNQQHKAMGFLTCIIFSNVVHSATPNSDFTVFSEGVGWDSDNEWGLGDVQANTDAKINACETRTSDLLWHYCFLPLLLTYPSRFFICFCLICLKVFLSRTESYAIFISTSCL